MPSYHMPETGSARSVGVRRIKKEFAFIDGTKVIARSQAEARRRANKLGEAPKVVLHPLGAVMGAPTVHQPTQPHPQQPHPGGQGGNTVATGGIQLTQATGLPITGDAGGTKKVTISLGFGGKTLAANAQATIVYAAGAGDVTIHAALTAGMTGNEAAQAIATEIAKVATLGAVAKGSDIDVTPTSGTALSKLTLTLA